MPFDAAVYLDKLYADCIRSADDLHDYQDDAVNWLYDHPMSGLYIDVGMGKTVAVYTLLDRLFNEGYRHKVLIIAPIRVATRVWPYEPRLWRHIAYMRTALIRIADGDPRVKAVYQRAYRRWRDAG